MIFVLTTWKKDKHAENQLLKSKAPHETVESWCRLKA